MKEYESSLVQAAERLIRGRRSQRAYLPRPVPEGTLARIFDLANQAPSASNTQPRRVEVVSGASRDRLSRALVEAAEGGRESIDLSIDQELYRDEYLDRMQQFGAGLYGTFGIAREDSEGRRRVYLDNLRFYGAPHATFLFVPDFLVARQSNDLGIYGQTLMLAMHGYGVSSCAQAILSMYADTVREVLNVPPSYRLV